jgi:hypothetical protein
MTRIVIGVVLAIGGAAAVIDNGPSDAGPIAIVLAACVALGGIARAGGPLAGRARFRLVDRECVRDWESDWDRDLVRKRKPKGTEISPGAIALVCGVLLVLAAVTVCGVIIVRKDRKKPDAEQASTNRLTDPQPAEPLPRPAPERTHPLPPIPFLPPVTPTPAPPESPAVRAPRPGLRETTPEGGAFARNDYREYRSEGSILTGFEVGYGKVFNTVIIAYLRPIWLTAKGEVYGTAYGRSQTPTVIVKARDGYAVGGIVIAGGGALEGFALTFMRIGSKHLLADDAYTSDWYGEPTRRPRPEAMKAGDGAAVVGLFGKRFDDRRGNNYDDGGAIATIGFVTWVKE